jgi:hypothetical protein
LLDQGTLHAGRTHSNQALLPKKPINSGARANLPHLQPYQPEADYPRCAYELVSDQHAQRGEVTGVDSLDCIITCLTQAGTMIGGLNESVFGGQLRWEASPSGGRGLGLPTIEDHWPSAEAYRKALRTSQTTIRRIPEKPPRQHVGPRTCCLEAITQCLQV